ncbi:N-(5'-phosphoribosyl)anthranilate isomerase [Streptomyces cremeus]|uniref:N-(5'-phosphoribosyl)anthranilate isomerase n=1 Tax=Streptomyces cremeus TaxID=66881 RepID=A0ABV5PPD8_STRCM
MLVKICGARTEGEVRAVAGAGADLVGLWHGVPGGRADLSAPRLARLAAEARATGRLRSVLVTFASQAHTLARTAVDSGVDWIQLHGYQRPALVRALRAQLPARVSLVKVLHVHGTSCPEASLIPAYERAGTDLFLLDAATADGRVGSTAHTLDDRTAAGLARRTTRPFLLAGGLRPDNRHLFDAVLADPRLCGIDVDSAARDDEGLLDAARTADLVRAWRTP